MKSSRTPATNPPARRRLIHYGLVFLGLVFVAHALIGQNGLFALLRAREDFRALEQRLSDIRVRNAVLQEETRRFREDPSAIEELARREHDMIKDGEKVYILRDVRPGDTPRK